MKLLLDTHIVIWAVVGDSRLTEKQREAIVTPSNELLVSAVAAYEYAHLQRDGRIPLDEDIGFLSEHLGFKVVEVPAAVWRKVHELPLLHRDPIDRIQVLHALVADCVLVTADRSIVAYPVDTLWR